MEASDYTFGTASLEILILLATAFILGAVLCYALKAAGLCCRRSEEMDEQEEQDFYSNLDTASMAMPSRKKQATASPESKLELTSGVAYEADLDTLLGRGNQSAPRPSPTPSSPGVSAYQPAPRDEAFERRKAAAAAAPSSGRFLGSSAPVEPVQVERSPPLEMPDADHEDDLGLLDGITAEAKSALNNAGIKNYAKLATMELNDLNIILDQAAGDFSQYEPKTWPYQAELAAKKNWDRLKEYQAFLRNQRS